MNKRYCCSDFHGIYDLWDQIKKYCDDTDTIFFLGDAADRGPDGIKIILELLKDKRVIYLKGNHEQLLINAFNIGNEWLNTLIENEGMSTWENFLKIGHQKDLIGVLERLPFYACYKNKYNNNIVLSHAGFTPHKNKIFNEEQLLWDRKHIKDKWNNYDNLYIIHGHTPIDFLTKDTRYPYFYCSGHKIDIDLGSAWSNKAALFDLDSFTYKIFYTKEKDTQDERKDYCGSHEIYSEFRTHNT